MSALFELTSVVWTPKGPLEDPHPPLFRVTSPVTRWVRPKKPRKVKAPPLFEVTSEITRPDLHGWLQFMDYRRVDAEGLRAYLADALLDKRPVAVDIESVSLNVYDPANVIVGVSVSCQEGTGVYVPTCHHVGAEHNVPVGDVVPVLQAAEAAGCALLFYNARFDLEMWTHKAGWTPDLPHWRDVMIGVFLLDSNVKTKGLKESAARLLRLRMLEFEEVFPTGFIADAHPDDVLGYVCADADLTRRLWLLPAIKEAVQRQALVEQYVERPLIPAVSRGVRQGCWVSRTHVARLREEVSTGIATARTQAQDMLGSDVLLSSPEQLGRRLVAMGVPIVEKTRKTGQVETGKEVLAKYAAEYPVCKAVVDLREWVALEQNYLSKLDKALAHFPTPLLRFPFNTMGAPTGRMSAGGEKGAYAKGLVDLNIQSMPEMLRSCFVANDPRVDTDEWVIVKIDFSQIEMRIAGNLSQEPAWVRAYQRGEDLHMVNTRLAYNNPRLQRGTPEGEDARDFGKTMGFALLYGATASTIAGHGRIAVKDAERLLDNFFAGAPNLKDWIARTQRAASQNGYVETFLNRRRDLSEFFRPDASKSLKARGYREAVNSPIQGSAADYFKLAVNAVETYLTQSFLLDVWCPFFWIHDELVSRVKRTHYAELLPGVLKAMSIPVRNWPIPMVPEAKVGWDWLTLVDPEEPLPPKPVWYAPPTAPPVTLAMVLSATPI